MTLLALSLCVLSQVQVQVQLPQIVFPAPPPLVVVEPGVQVVEDNDEEVFFVENVYWVRRDGRWFKSKDHKGNWVVVDGPAPPGLAKQPPGKYKRWKGNKGAGGPPDDGPGKGNKGNGKGKGKK